MERLVVDSRGAVTIPPNVLQGRGLSPGDELNVEEIDQGWIVSPNTNRNHIPAWYEKWWSGLTEEERELAREEARQYWALSEKERDAMWAECDGDLSWVDDDDEEDEDDEGEIERTEEQRLTGKHASR